MRCVTTKTTSSVTRRSPNATIIQDRLPCEGSRRYNAADTSAISTLLPVRDGVILAAEDTQAGHLERVGEGRLLVQFHAEAGRTAAVEIAPFEAHVRLDD